MQLQFEIENLIRIQLHLQTQLQIQIKIRIQMQIQIQIQMQTQISNSNATCHPPRNSNAKCKCILKCKCRMQMQNQGKQLKAFSQILLWLETVLSGPVWLPSPTFFPLSFTLDALIEIEIFSFLLKGLIVFVPRSASSSIPIFSITDSTQV